MADDHTTEPTMLTVLERINALGKELYELINASNEKASKQLDGFGKQLGEFNNRLDESNKQLGEFNNRLDGFGKQLGEFKERLDESSNLLGEFGRRLDGIETTLESMKANLSLIDSLTTITRHEFVEMRREFRQWQKQIKEHIPAIQ